MTLEWQFGNGATARGATPGLVESATSHLPVLRTGAAVAAYAW